jgi:hypothetical protein
LYDHRIFSSRCEASCRSCRCPPSSPPKNQNQHLKMLLAVRGCLRSSRQVPPPRLGRVLPSLTSLDPRNFIRSLAQAACNRLIMCLRWAGLAVICSCFGHCMCHGVQFAMLSLSTGNTGFHEGNASYDNVSLSNNDNANCTAHGDITNSRRPAGAFLFRSQGSWTCLEHWRRNITLPPFLSPITTKDARKSNA